MSSSLRMIAKPDKATGIPVAWQVIHKRMLEKHFMADDDEEGVEHGSGWA